MSAPDPDQDKKTAAFAKSIGDLGHIVVDDEDEQRSQILPAGFEIGEKLGAGSFGSVYKVKTPGGFTAAMKVIYLTNRSTEGVKEYRSVHLIRCIQQHNHLVRYQAVWLRTADGKLLTDIDNLEQQWPALLKQGMDLLILMELANSSLSDRLKEYKAQGMTGIPVSELLPYMHGAARGLDFLHKRVHDIGGGQMAQIVHRDVKPGNLLIFGEDVKVADYGVARAITADVHGSGAISGTLAYSAPEIYKNEPGPGTDQYALAITYYELRTGQFPFDPNEAMWANINGELSFDKVSDAEREVLQIATSRNVQDRYSSCVAFVEDLRRALGLSLSGELLLPDRRSGAVSYPSERSRIGQSSNPDIDSPQRRLSGSTTDTPRSPHTDHDNFGTLDFDPNNPQPGSGNLPPGSYTTGSATQLPQSSKWMLVLVAIISLSATLGGAGLAYLLLKDKDDNKVVVTDPDNENPDPVDNGKDTPVPPEKEDPPKEMSKEGPKPPPDKPKKEPPPPPPNVARLFDDSTKAIDNRNYAQAVSTFDEIIKSDPPKSDRERAEKLQTEWAKVVELNKLNDLNPPQLAELIAQLNRLRTRPPELTSEDTARLRTFYNTLFRNKVERVVSNTPPEREPLGNLLKTLNALNSDSLAILGNDFERVWENSRSELFTALLAGARKRVTADDDFADGIDWLKLILDSSPKQRVRETATLLNSAWEQADTFSKAKQLDLEQLGEVVKLAQNVIPDLERVDAEYLRTYYRGQLGDRIAVDVAKLDPETDWDATAKLLDNLRPESFAEAIWPVLFRNECRLVNEVINGKEIPSSARRLPALPKEADDKLQAYHAYLQAALNTPNRAAAEQLAKAPEALKKAGLFPELRQLIVGKLLLRSASRLPNEDAVLDDPFPDEANGKAAREWLELALPLLNAAPEAEQKQARSLLVLAAGFPEPDRKLADQALGDFKPTDLAGALIGSLQDSYWLAMARTRDQAEADGIATAVLAYNQLAERLPSRLDRKFIQEFLQSDGYLKAIRSAPAAVQADASSAYLLLANRTFTKQPTGVVEPNDSDPVSLAADLIGIAAELDPKPEIQARAGFFTLGAQRDRDKYSFHLEQAEKLRKAAKDPAVPNAYLGLIQSLIANLERDYQGKYDGFLLSASSLEQATGLPETDPLLPRVYRHLSVAGINAANAGHAVNVPNEKLTEILETSFEAAQKFRQFADKDPESSDVLGAVYEDRAWLVKQKPFQDRREYYSRAKDAFQAAITGYQNDNPIQRATSYVHLGRNWYKWAEEETGRDQERLLADAKRALEDVFLDGRDIEKAEAHYWLYRVEFLKTQSDKADRILSDEGMKQLASIVAIPDTKTTRVWRKIGFVNWSRQMPSKVGQAADADQLAKLTTAYAEVIDRFQKFHDEAPADLLFQAAVADVNLNEAALAKAGELRLDPEALKKYWEAFEASDQAAQKLEADSTNLDDKFTLQLARLKAYAQFNDKLDLPKLEQAEQAIGQLQELGKKAEPGAKSLPVWIEQLESAGRDLSKFANPASGKDGGPIAQLAQKAFDLGWQLEQDKLDRDKKIVVQFPARYTVFLHLFKEATAEETKDSGSGLESLNRAHELITQVESIYNRLIDDEVTINSAEEWKKAIDTQRANLDGWLLSSIEAKLKNKELDKESKEKLESQLQEVKSRLDAAEAKKE